MRDEWQVVGFDAFDVLGLDRSAALEDVDVERAAFLRHHDAELVGGDRDRIHEALETLRTAERRAGYLAAAEQAEMHGGIAQVLCGEHAAYRRLLNAVVKVRGSFSLQLPQIMVCGMENEGKSSVLERIAMREIFPRDKRFCTRMPVRLMLRCNRHCNDVVIRLVDTNTDTVVRESERYVCKTGDQSDEPFSSRVAEEIKAFICEVHPDDDGDNVVVDREVQVEIRAPNVPTIDLVDLPGIVSAPEKAHNDTVALTQRMLAVPHTLVLAVVSGRSQSLRNNGIWGLLREAAKPAVAVLTMVDKPGGDEDLKDRLDPGSREFPRDAGITTIVPVVNRDTTSKEAETLRGSFATEHRVLQERCASHGIEFDPSKHGMPAVLAALGAMLESYMRECWVDSETARARAELQRLLTKLWHLGKKPSTVTVEDLVEGVERGSDMFLNLCTTELARLFACSVDLGVVPERAPLLRRLRLRADLKAAITAQGPALIETACASIKATLHDKIVTESKIPLNLSRFGGVVQMLDAALAAVMLEAQRKILREFERRAADAIDSATSSATCDQIDARNLQCAIDEALLVAVLAHTCGDCDRVTPRMEAALRDDADALDLSETDEAVAARLSIEAAIEAVYAAKAALDEIRKPCDGPDDFEAAKCFSDGGPNGSTPPPSELLGTGLFALAPNSYVHELVSASNALRNCDDDFLAAAIRCNVEPSLSCLRPNHYGCRDVMLAAVSRNGCLLGKAAPALRADRDVVLAALSNNVEALQYVADSVLWDEAVVAQVQMLAPESALVQNVVSRYPRMITKLSDAQVLACASASNEIISLAVVRMAANPAAVCAALRQAPARSMSYEKDVLRALDLGADTPDLVAAVYLALCRIKSSTNLAVPPSVIQRVQESALSHIDNVDLVAKALGFVKCCVTEHKAACVAFIEAIIRGGSSHDEAFQVLREIDPGNELLAAAPE